MIPSDIKWDPNSTPPQFTDNEESVIQVGTHIRLKIVGTRAEVGHMFAIASIKEDYLGWVLCVLLTFLSNACVRCLQGAWVIGRRRKWIFRHIPSVHANISGTKSPPCNNIKTSLAQSTHSMCWEKHSARFERYLRWLEGQYKGQGASAQAEQQRLHRTAKCTAKGWKLKATVVSQHLSPVSIHLCIFILLFSHASAHLLPRSA